MCVFFLKQQSLLCILLFQIVQGQYIESQVQVSVISSEMLCKDGTDSHFYSTCVGADYVLLKFMANKAHIHIDREYQTIQILDKFQLDKGV